MPAAFLARVGLIVFAILFGMLLVTEQPVAARALVASAGPAAPGWSERQVAPRIADEPVAVGLVVSVAAAPEPVAPEIEPEPDPEPEPEPAPAVAAPVVGGGEIVLASWYGPGFYGNRTACGQTYSPQIQGVANKTLPCGTLLTLSFGSRSITVPVIDRGPYIAGRTLDLSAATKAVLGCSDLCTIRMQLAR